MPTYSVIIPCYNEEEVLPETHKRMTRVMQGMGESYELIYVNDGSRDDTAKILEDICKQDANARAIMFARNAGHQMAVSAGLDYADGDAVIIIDADLQDPPEVIPEMAKRWKDGVQVVYGQRKKRDGETFFKKFTASVYYKSLSKLTNGMVPRDTGDFRLVDRQVADVIRSMPEHARFLRGMFAWAGFKQEAYLYDRDKRFAGETHYPLKKMLKLAADGVFSFSVKPLKAAWMCGLCWIGLGCLIGFVLLICLLFGASSSAWWLAALMMVLAGNVLVCVGIAGEYMGRIYDDVRARPLYIVARTLGFDRAE